MGKPKLKRQKTRHHYSLACIKELRELRDRLTPTGLEMTDGQAIDVIVSTMHGVIIEKGLEIVDPERMLALTNEHFKKTFSEFLVQILTQFGHTDVTTKWRKDGSVQVRCDVGSFTVPSEVFGRADADSQLRELKTGLTN